jgi:hypothetical protein
MIVQERTQTTDVVVRRTVTHYLEHEGVAYIRYCKVTTTVPYMDHAVKVLSEKIRWQKRINEHQVEEIFKKDVKDLELEKWFGYCTPKEINGNVRDYWHLAQANKPTGS